MWLARELPSSMLRSAHAPTPRAGASLTYGRDLGPHQSMGWCISMSATTYSPSGAAPIPLALLHVSKEAKVTCSHSS